MTPAFIDQRVIWVGWIFGHASLTQLFWDVGLKTFTIRFYSIVFSGHDSLHGSVAILAREIPAPSLPLIGNLEQFKFMEKPALGQ